MKGKPRETRELGILSEYLTYLKFTVYKFVCILVISYKFGSSKNLATPNSLLVNFSCRNLPYKLWKKKEIRVRVFLHTHIFNLMKFHYILFLECSGSCLNEIGKKIR